MSQTIQPNSLTIEHIAELDNESVKAFLQVNGQGLGDDNLN